MSKDWSAYAKTISNAFKSDGAPAIIRIKTSNNYDIATGKNNPTYKDRDVHIFFSKTTNINEQINRDELLILCTPTFLTNELQNVKNKVLIYDEIEYEIIESKAIMPGGVPLLYKLICRK